MQNKAATVEQYLAQLPEDRRQALEAVRAVFKQNLDADFEEGMQYGMIGYYVPHRVYPAGYHCDPKQPLPFAGLASQKGHMSLHLCCLYGDDAQLQKFQAAWAKTGKKLDMGKACIRFKQLDDVALDVIADTIRATPARKFIQQHEALIGSNKRPSADGKPAAKAKANAKANAKASAKASAKSAAKKTTKKAARKAAKKTAKKPAPRGKKSR